MSVRRSNAGGVVRNIVVAMGAVAIIVAVGVFYAELLEINVPALGRLGLAASQRVTIAKPPAVSAAPAPEPRTAEPELAALLGERLDELRAESLDPANQGILVESLFGETLMAHNADLPINPASVLKLAPTLMALERFGPDHRFRTAFVAGGPVLNGVLDGSIGLRTDGDPSFGRQQAADLVSRLRAAGVREVTGDFVVAGPFSFNSTEETPVAADLMRGVLTRAGIRVAGSTRFGESVDGVELAAVDSEPLLDIVQRQNAHSVNRLADNLGTTVGGPQAVEHYFVEKLGVSPSEVTVSHTSGLGHNAVSARGAMLLLRALYETTAREGITLDRIIPLNGVDDGTMRSRLLDDGLEGAVAAKTGTHYTQDGGISTLCGVAYTRDKGPVFFVILNSVGSVRTYRKWEDELVADMIIAEGGSRPLARAAEVQARK